MMEVGGFFNVTAVVLLWFGLAYAVAGAARARGRSPSAFLFLTLILSPIITFPLLILMASNADAEDHLRGRIGRCPACAEKVKLAARCCPCCETNFGQTPPLRLERNIHAITAGWMLAISVLCFGLTVAAALLERPPQPAKAAASDVEIPTSEARKHVGEHATVCGVLTHSVFAKDKRGQPTFLNFGREFSAVIWKSERAKFRPAPEDVPRGTDICVNGVIEIYAEKPRITVRDPNQITRHNPTAH